MEEELTSGEDGGRRPDQQRSYGHNKSDKRHISSKRKNHTRWNEGVAKAI